MYGQSSEDCVNIVEQARAIPQPMLTIHKILLEVVFVME